MRITAGIHRSRILKTLPNDNTRPTLDKVKEAVFSRIGPYFEGGLMLDLFSGSGAIALEAISRGFDKALMNDKNRQAVQIIKTNVALLKEEEHCEIFQLDYQKMLQYCLEKGLQFDLIYIDPPYALRLLNTVLPQCLPLLKDSGVIVTESLPDETIDSIGGLKIDKTADYGTVRVTYLRKEL